MPTHDVIDNREQKLCDHVRKILETADAARFAVGYFFVSGLDSIAAELENVRELRLLIGNTTNRETLEQLAEGYRRLELVADAAEAQAYPRRAEMREMAERAGENLRGAVELMDQTDEGERLVRALVRLIEEQRLRVRVHTRGRLHAKAYIFDYPPQGHYEKGIAIVGSSNLTLAGLTHNTELNVVVHGNDNHAALVRWFDELWDDAQEFDETLMRELRASWAGGLARPYDVYMKTLHALVRDRLEAGEETDVLWDDEITRRLAGFQRVAVRQAVQIIRDFGGAFVSDVVGLGKSFVGAAIVRHFERTEHARALIVCPAPLVDMWERYNEAYDLNARVLSMGVLREDGVDGARRLLEDVRYRDRDFVLIDESHHFRRPGTQRYRVMEAFLATGRRCCMLTATPRNQSAWDVYHQIKLFHPDERTDFPIDPPLLRDWFRRVEKGERSLPDLLSNILIRRTRAHVLRWYGHDAETHAPVDPARFTDYASGRRRAYVLVGGRHQFFPRRELAAVEYSIEDTYQGLYQQLRGFLGRAGGSQPKTPRPGELTFARYGLWHYARREVQAREPYASLHRAGSNLRGLVRVLLFKRFESSVHAFRETVRRLLRAHEGFLAGLDSGLVPAGEAAQKLLIDPDYGEQDLIDALFQVASDYPVEDFDLPRLRAHVRHDVDCYRQILALVEPITPDRDAKLRTLVARFGEGDWRDRKRLLFTQYADTARYLYEALNPGGARTDVEVLYSGDRSKSRVIGRFSPRANPEQRPRDGEGEISLLIATDVLSEGLNLQDCDTIINYDLHWNPVRLIQRFGRIDRIGGTHERVWGFNFLPETALDRNLGLRRTLGRRIQEIHDTIGEDAAILEQTERLNEESMYAIYVGGEQGDLWETDEGDALLDLNEAEELLRQLRADDPAEYERIAALRDGIRSAKAAEGGRGTFVFCQAGRFQQLFLVDPEGEVASRDVPRVLGAVRCAPDTPAAALPAGYNAAVMAVKRRFVEEVKHRAAEREFSSALTQAQRYVMRELRVLFKATESDEVREQVNVLERSFRAPLTAALKKELNAVRRNALTGEALLRRLADLYHQHHLREWTERRGWETDEVVPRIVCSMGLV
ncbi:MAG TPA: helicase-related protein [Longimicrobiaceae bacterium]|nr:helicase-related protein [Longimicrobiaceae bacterium]